MTDPTPDDLATLAREMGHTVTLDDSGGYGVVRLIATSPRGGQMVFRPHESAAQAWEVMAWLMRSVNCNRYRQGFIEMRPLAIALGQSAEDDTFIDHDGTAAGIRRAVVEAAIRVAKG